MKAFSLYPRLTINGIGKNRQTYIPYIFTCSGMVMMYYIISFLSNNSMLADMPGGALMEMILTLGCVIMILFSAVFMFYTNSFLIKRRKKELGLYNILGMSKKNIYGIMLWESLIIYVISVICGTGCGILFSKAAELLMTNLIKADVSYTFRVDISSVISVLIWFGIIFLLILINSLRQVHIANPAELLRSENTGEKPPKLNIGKAVLGAVLLIAAYAIALKIEDPVLGVGIFFIAVVMVIFATELLFTAGSVALCKLLQKNKTYYYKTRNFVSVSQMVFRMNSNGKGLADICILSTMVLVTICSTVSLYAGEENTLARLYPHDMAVTVSSVDSGVTDSVYAEMDRIIAEKGLSPENTVKYGYYSTGASLDGNKAVTDYREAAESGSLNTRIVTVLPVSDYNAYYNESLELAEGEAYIFAEKDDYSEDSFILGENEFTVKGKADIYPVSSISDMYIYPSVILYVKDMDAVKACADEFGTLNTYCGFDLSADDDTQTALAAAFEEGIQSEVSVTVNSASRDRQEFYAMYGGIFFLGIILSIIFLCAAVLTMYYKQISEGYEDRSRFEILRKVGMTTKEIKQSINSQVFTVFFAPLAAAVVHTLFALPAITKLLELFGFTDTVFFFKVAFICFGVFAVVYVVSYLATSKSYYKVTSE